MAALLIILTMVVSACGGGNAAPVAPTALPAGTIKVSFVYGSEKKDWVNAVTKTFNDSNPKTPSGKNIVVEPLAIGSGESATEILTGKLQPALWSPASSLWVPLVNDDWALKNAGRPYVDTQVEPCKNSVLSPVVIAMWRPMAEALGWPQKEIGWKDLADLATKPNGWASVGKPQLGKFKFGHTHPDYSNSGMQTIVAMAYAASDAGRVLTIEDVQNPATKTLLNTLESAIAHYGSSTGFFGDAMVQRGISYLSAAVVYENIVASSYNDAGLPKSPDRIPLVAIYPKEGTFFTDHPLCIPDASYMTDDLRVAAKVYRDYLLTKPAQQRALEFGFRPSDATIPLTSPLVVDRGIDPQQPKTTLASPDAKTIRAVRELWKQQKRQVNLSVVIDISGSMREENRIAGARTGSIAFMDMLDQRDTVTVLVFDDKIDTLYDSVNVGSKRDAIKKDLGLLLPRGGTALFDATCSAVEKLKYDPKKINAVVVMTDGEETSSTRYRTLSSLLNGCLGSAENPKNDVVVFTIGYGKGAKMNDLCEIAKRGNGKCVSGNTADIDAVFRDIATFF